MKRRHDFSLNPIKDPRRAIWHVNEDPVKLDDFYERFLGRHGARMLPEELKWLAVTHKSFDYGRRGFNTRLAFFGMPALFGMDWIMKMVWAGNMANDGVCYRTADIGP